MEGRWLSPPFHPHGPLKLGQLAEFGNGKTVFGMGQLLESYLVSPAVETSGAEAIQHSKCFSMAPGADDPLLGGPHYPLSTQGMQTVPSGNSMWSRCWGMTSSRPQRTQV